ncbi:MAG: hypothetical protein QOJ68_1647 [Blastococcus sp.]|jgi:hypothetical protein|nr:hypothetical protein [Blastococcus sp.]
MTTDPWPHAPVPGTDGTGQHPQLAVGRDRALGGMGLQLVADLTSAGGWTLSDGDKLVWALIPAA